MYRYRRWPTTVWNPWMEMQRLHDDMQRYFGSTDASAEVEYPEIALWAGEKGARLSARLPGLDPKDIDVSVVGDTLTLRAVRPTVELEKGQTWHRRERATGRSVRTVQLPHAVDTERVRATYDNGILEVELPRTAQETPRRIQVTAR